LIRFLDLEVIHRGIEQELSAAAKRVIRSGTYIGGPEVAAFEEEWAAYVGADHCVGVANGLDALSLALRAVGVGPGDEVLVPAHTFIATWLAVSSIGATPVGVDPLPGSHLIDAVSLEQHVTPRTRAVVPVHLYGDPVDLNPILALADRHGFAVVEDAAQAHGARYAGRPVGAHGDAVAWSFYPGKNLGALGDAGAVTTNNLDVAERVRRLGNYGSTEKYVHVEKGANSRLDPLQAAILRVKLPHLESWTQRRQELAERYEALLPIDCVVKAVAAPFSRSVHHLFVVRVENRDAVRQHLAASGVETGVHYPTPPHRQSAYASHSSASSSFPMAEVLADEALSLPMGPHLTSDDIGFVCDRLRTIDAA
jgi:dTDP-4-amino-4,6-dideoxygalactose transaminase